MLAEMSQDAAWPRAGAWPDFDGTASDAVLIGIGTHETSISLTRADTTPAAVRAALPRFSPFAYGASRPVAALRVADAGDIEHPDRNEADATAAVREAAASARLTIVLGGDNAATVPAALGGFGDNIATAGLITVDAHHDLRDGVSNGSPVRRLVEAGLAPKRIVQIGIQDFTNSAEYARRAEQSGVTVISRAECEEAPMREIARRALDIAASGGGPIHIDIDVDACDRSVVPACPASAPGGLSAWQMRSLVRALTEHTAVRSIDFTEVDATADTEDGRTVRLVALCVLEALAGLAERG